MRDGRGLIPEVPASPQIEAALREEMDEGERLIWSGRPRPWVMARSALPTFLVGIPFFAFAVSWTCMAIWFNRNSGNTGSNAAPAFFRYFPLWGTPFMCFGLGMLLSPLFSRARALRTVYALTDRRAILMMGRLLGGRVVKSYLSEELGGMVRKERSDGSGDLVFNEVVTSVRSQGGKSEKLVVTEPRGFLGICGVREVEKLVRATLVDRASTDARE